MATNLRTTVPEGASVRTRLVPMGHLNITATAIGSPDVLFTVQPGIPLEVKRLAIANLTAGVVKVSLHTHLETDAAATSNAEFLGLALQAGDVVDVSASIKGYYPENTVFSVYTDTAGGANIHGFGEENL